MLNLITRRGVIHFAHFVKINTGFYGVQCHIELNFFFSFVVVVVVVSWLTIFLCDLLCPIPLYQPCRVFCLLRYAYVLHYWPPLFYLLFQKRPVNLSTQPNKWRRQFACFFHLMTTIIPSVRLICPTTMGRHSLTRRSRISNLVN